ncbi:MAG: hypothetical protein LBR44_08090 [Clostridiales Family XIII bacterium]|nr:hypothetical protein [Clostridiales Family XIII bacterium]
MSGSATKNLLVLLSVCFLVAGLPLSSCALEAGEPASATEPGGLRISPELAEAAAKAEPVTGAHPEWLFDVFGTIVNHEGEVVGTGERVVVNLERTKALGFTQERVRNARTEERLFDIHGNLVRDWDFASYDPGPGRFVSVVSGGDSDYDPAEEESPGVIGASGSITLLDPLTGEAPAEPFLDTCHTEDGGFVAIREDGTIAKYDADAKQIKVLLSDDRFSSLSAFGDHVFVADDYWVTKEAAAIVVFDDACNVLAEESDYHDYALIAGDALCLPSRGYCLTKSLATVALPDPLNFEKRYGRYYETAGKGFWYICGEDGINRLFDSNGKLLAEDIRDFEPLTYAPGGGILSFIYVSNDWTAQILSADGTLVEQANLLDYIQDPDYIFFRSGYIEVHGEDVSRTFVYASGLQEVWSSYASGNGDFTQVLPLRGDVMVSGLSEGMIAYFDSDAPRYIMTSVPQSGFNATHAASIQRANFYDMQGNLIAGDITPQLPALVTEGHISYGPDRIVAKKGFSCGLMDLEGNWVYEGSIFTSLED